MSRRKRIFYVEMRNRTDSRDDEMWKVLAFDKLHARAVDPRGRFTVGDVWTPKELRKADPEWHRLLYRTPARELY